MDPYGLKRVVGEIGVLPQRAERLDPSLPLREDELLVDVDSLNIDAASFKQLEGEVGHSPEALGQRILEIVRARGKMHNPVTGSGGMLIGRVREIGPKHPAFGIPAGTRIATLVSLTLTPLQIDSIRVVHPDSDRVDVTGHAILFSTGLFAPLPSDLPETLALAALDVCGAPAQVARLARPEMTVAVIGAGKSGALCLAQARRSMENRGRLIALDVSEEAIETLRQLALCDHGITVDATNAVEVMGAIERATDGELCDLVINCASVPGTEMATILACRDGGAALFFSMATSFTAAALGAEGIGKDVMLLMGSGFVPGHAELTLNLLRTEPELLALFGKRFAV